MTDDRTILIDSDAFIGLFFPNDAHHADAMSMFSQMRKYKLSVLTTSGVVAETATVLSHRQGQELARTFLEKIIDQGEFPVYFLTETIYREALDLFKAQAQRGTSFTDCANVIVAEQLGINRIFSYDQHYPKYFGLQLLRNGL